MSEVHSTNDCLIMLQTEVAAGVIDNPISEK